MLRRLTMLGALLLLLAAFAGDSAWAGEPANPIALKSPRLANLWLCNQGGEGCANTESGVEQVTLNLDLSDQVVGEAKGVEQRIGSFEFEVRYDTKLVSAEVHPGDLFAGEGVTCNTNEGEGFVQFHCVTKGKPEDAPVGPGGLAQVVLRATPDVYSMLIANQENGITTQVINQDCQLSDLQGHPIKLGEPGSVVDPCGDADVTIRYLEGDVHADCVVDAMDQQQIAFRWGSHLGSLLYNSRFDLEPSAPKKGDGDIDAKDLQFVYGRHSSTCKDPHPAQDPADPKECVAGEALEAGGPGVNLLDPATLLVAQPIFNEESVPAQNVRLTSIVLDGETLTVPSSLPYGVGTIPAGGSADLQAQFSGAFEPSGSYNLTIEGDYVAGDTVYCFTLQTKLVVPPAAPGSATLGSIAVDASSVTGAPFPPVPPEEEEEASENPPNWVVPSAPPAPPDTTSGETSIDEAPGGGSGGESVAGGDAAGVPPVVFNTNNSKGLTGTNTIAEPSGAVTGGGVVFATVNTSAAYSSDGSTFTQLNPTTIFPNDAVGFCCDQIVQYAPSIDRFFWFLQGSSSATAQGYRLAMASPATITSSGGTAWTYWNLTPQLFGQPAGTRFDYPDMSLGNGFLYMSWDAGALTGGCPSGCSQGFQVARISLSDLAGAGTVTVEFTDPTNGTMAWGSHLMQDTGDEEFWAGHNSNKQMRIFSLREDSNTYFWRDRDISTWANNAPSSTTPDGQDWLGKNFSGTGGGGAFPKNAVIGATRAGSSLWFAWSAGTDSNFSQAHIEMVRFNRDTDFSKAEQVQIWNSNYAFAYPSLATNDCTAEVGLSFEYGGGGNYENHVVGFWGDFIAYATTSSNVGTTRFGDYVTVRQVPATEANPGNMLAAFGYGLNSVPPPGSGTSVDVHYVQFGRPASSCTPIIIG